MSRHREIEKIKNRFIMKYRYLIINKIGTNIILLLTAFFTMSAVLLNAGCGKKAPPLPPLKYMLNAPSHLNYTLSGNMVTLQWVYVTEKDGYTGCRGFKVFRAERDLSKNGCKGCPLKFHEVGSVAPSRFNYTAKLKKGFQYYYKIRAYSGDNDLSPNSNTIEFRFQ